MTGRTTQEARIEELVEMLLPLTQLGVPWRASFEAAAQYAQEEANAASRAFALDERESKLELVAAYRTVLARVSEDGR